MDESVFYTIADIAMLTGAKPRTIQFWAQSGVINATPETAAGGRGTHRLFPLHEAIVALVINPIANIHVSIGDLVKIANAFREDAGRKSLWPEIEACISGSADIDFIMANSAKHLSVGLHPRDPGEPEDVTRSRIGTFMLEQEKEIGALSIWIPLSTHLRVLR